MKSKQKISILMANFNNSYYIDEAIQSVINQSDNRWELIVIDDCSTDKSVDVIEKYLNDERVRFFQNQKNIGYIKTLELMIEKANSSVVGILDSDDALNEEAVHTILQAYDQNPSVGMVYSQYYVCDQDLNKKHLGFSGAIKNGKTNLHLNVAHHFKTFRKETYYLTSGYDEEIKYAEDIDLNLKIEEVAKLLFVDKPLYFYRVLVKSQTHGFKNLRTNRSSTALAKLNAYKRRLGTTIPNLSRVELSEVLFFGAINAFLAMRFKLLIKLKTNLFFIYPIFLFDPRFYILIYKKIKKIKNLKKEKPLLGV